MDLDADPRLAAEDSGADPDTDGRRLTIEARFGFSQLLRPVICQKDSFLCAAKGVEISIAFQKKTGGVVPRRTRSCNWLESDRACGVS